MVYPQLEKASVIKLLSLDQTGVGRLNQGRSFVLGATVERLRPLDPLPQESADP
jgi:hypothetical protein